MKFEKLSENKLRITLSMKDLEEKDINFHDFMSNSIETQDLFLDMLEEAEEQVGFNTKNYKVKIEALAMTDRDFIVTITRMMPEFEKAHLNTSISKKKFKVRRKQIKTEAKQTIYKFNSFDDYCSFIQYLVKNHLESVQDISKEAILYSYKNQYYLILDDINSEYVDLLKFYHSILEFATYVNNSVLFISKLHECGHMVVKNNALQIGLKHFSKSQMA